MSTITDPGPSEALRVRFVRGSYFGLLGTVVAVVSNFTASVILARLLDPQGLGAYYLYVVLGSVAIGLLTLAIPSAVTKYVSELRTRGDPRLGSFLSTSFLILLLVGIVGSLVVALVVAPLAAEFYRDPVLLTMIQIMGALAVANLVSTYLTAILIGLEEFAASSVVGSLTDLANIAFLLWFLLAGWGLVGAALAGGLSVVLSVLVGAWLTRSALRRHGIPWSWTVSRRDAGTVAGFVGPLNAASLLSRASSLAQNSIVVVGLGFLELGYLRVATFFYNALLFIPKLLIAPMLPLLSSMIASRSRDRQREILGQLVKNSLLLIGPLAAGLILGLPFGIRFFYGPEYLPALPFAIVFVAAGMATFPCTILGDQYLLATGRTMISLAVTAFSAGVSLLAVVALFGSVAAMALPIATLTTEGVLFVVLLWWLSRRQELAVASLVPTVAFVAFAILGSTGLQFLLPPDAALLLALPVATALGLGAYYVLMDESERRTVTSALLRGRGLPWRRRRSASQGPPSGGPGERVAKARRR